MYGSNRYYCAVALAESCVLKQPHVSVELARGDFLVFDHDSDIFSFKSEEFHQRFLHAEGRGTYVFVEAEHANHDIVNCCQKLPRCTKNIDDNSDSDKIDLSEGVTQIISLAPFYLNQENASKWIQRTTMLAFSLNLPTSIISNCDDSHQASLHSGLKGDVLVIHCSGLIEDILSADNFQRCFSFLNSDEAVTGSSVSMNDEIFLSATRSDSPACQSAQHLWEVKRLCPILAREMREPFSPIVPSHRCSGEQLTRLRSGQAGDFLLQDGQVTTKHKEGCFVALSSSSPPGDTGESEEGCGAGVEEEVEVEQGVRQWVLSSDQIQQLFIRLEEEKTGTTVSSHTEVLEPATDIADDAEGGVERSADLFKMLPAEAFLPHYKCWEGVVHRRTRITHQWRANYAVLYPNRLVLGKDFPIASAENRISEELKVAHQTIHLTYCTIHPARVDGREAMFLDDVNVSDVLDKHRPLKPYSTTKKTAVRTITKFASRLAATVRKPLPGDVEVISEGTGIYFSLPPPPSLMSPGLFASLLASAVLHCRRDMALAATKAGDCGRVLELLRSVAPGDAVSILKTLCPIDASPGMLLQHEAAKTSVELMRALFPVKNDVTVSEFSVFREDLDIHAFSSSGFMCLHYAVLANNIDVVRYLLENEEFNLSTSTTTRTGKTPLHLVTGKDVMTFLLGSGASLTAEDDGGNIPLMSLISCGSSDVVLTFLEHSSSIATFDINARSWQTGFSALSCAIRTFSENSVSIVQSLLQRGADPNLTDLRNNSALHIAAFLFITLSRCFAVDEGSMQKDIATCFRLMQLLVDAGGDILLQNDDGRTPFLLLCHSECFQPTAEAEKILDLLTTTKCDNDCSADTKALFDVRSDSTGSYPLHIVVQSGNSSLLEMLIKRGANINPKDFLGRTPLDLVHAAQEAVTAATPLRTVEQIMGCLIILTQHRALKRLRKDLPMEVDQSVIKFVPSSQVVGRYEVKSATLPTLVARLCSELLYSDCDAEALLFSLEDSSTCAVMIDLIASNYPKVVADQDTMSPFTVIGDVEAEEGATNVITLDDGGSRACVDASASGRVSDSPSSNHKRLAERINLRNSTFTDALENSPGGLLLLLRMWFEFFPNSFDVNNEEFVRTLRALAVSLVSDYPHELSISSRTLLATAQLEDFEVQDLVTGFKCVMTDPAACLRQGISPFPRNKEKEQVLDSLLAEFDSPNWSIKAFDMIGANDSTVIRLCQLAPLRIAQQASIMQHHLHKRVSEQEILSLKYSDETLCPHIALLRMWNDNVANCFVSEILNDSCQKKRAEVICHILDIAFHALEALNNFELVVMILGVLECTAVYRLKRTWALVELKQPGRRKLFKYLAGIGGRNVRSLMQHALPPLVPYLGVYMQQMINLHEMPSKYKFDDCEEQHVNLSKFRSVLGVLNSHRKSQAKYFDLDVDEDVQRCLRRPMGESCEEAFLRLSAALEP